MTATAALSGLDATAISAMVVRRDVSAVEVVHAALDRLAQLDGRQAQVMTLRYLGGMTVAEVAAALGISVTTVEHDWRLARAWLAGQLGGWDG